MCFCNLLAEVVLFETVLLHNKVVKHVSENDSFMFEIDMILIYDITTEVNR